MRSKNCPFCNGEPILHLNKEPIFYIECNSCGARSPKINGRENVYELIDIWNDIYVRDRSMEFKDFLTKLDRQNGKVTPKSTAAILRLIEGDKNENKK